MFKLIKHYFRFLQIRTCAVVAGVLFLSATHVAAQQPTVQMCRQMLIDIQLRGEGEKNASRGNDLAQTRAAYKSSQGQKELFEGECSNHPQARNFVSYGIDAMRENGAFCQRLGGGSDCGVGPGQGYRAQRGAVDNAAGRPDTSPVGRNTQGASSGNNSAANTASGNPVTSSGAPCAAVTQTGTENKRGISETYLRHEYRITNSCDAKVRVKLITNAGRETSVYLNGGASSIWFCTDGFTGNSDCKGGIRGFITTYPN